MSKFSFHCIHSFRGSTRVFVMDDFGNLHLTHRGQVEHFIAQSH
jgi:hypothetical protein